MRQLTRWPRALSPWLLVFLVGLTILAEIFMPVVMAPFVPGFLDDPEKYDLTVLLTRICFPYLAFMSLMAAYSGILNALGRFTASAAAPILLNIASIVFVPMLIIGIESLETTAIWVAIAIIAGGSSIGAGDHCGQAGQFSAAFCLAAGR